MVGLGGLEPPASPLSGVRSNHLSYRPVAFAESTHAAVRFLICSPRMDPRPNVPGGADRDRTGDPLLAKQVLSQLSYSPMRWN